MKKLNQQDEEMIGVRTKIHEIQKKLSIEHKDLTSKIKEMQKRQKKIRSEMGKMQWLFHKTNNHYTFSIEFNKIYKGLEFIQ